MGSTDFGCSTLSFDFPEDQTALMNSLICFYYSKNNLEILSLKGSNAGAMGYGQFIPSSYGAYAIDFDNDGYVDLLTLLMTRLAIANYLYIHGWNKDFNYKKNRSKIFCVQSINNAEESINIAPNILHASDELENEDILDQSVLLLSYHERGNTDFVGTANFIAITKYNRIHFMQKRYMIYQLIKMNILNLFLLYFPSQH